MRFTALPFFGWDYYVHSLIPKKTESGEPQIKKIGEKLQDNNEFILHKNLKNSKGNQITDMIQEFDPPLMGYLDYGN